MQRERERVYKFNKTEKLFQSGITSQINIQISIPNLLKNGSIAKLSYEINMSFITKTFSNVNKQLHTVDHHSLEYGPSNKNLFQTMGVFHTMGGFI